MIETAPGCRSAVATSAARSWQAGELRQPVTSPTIERTSPRASALTSPVIADCSAEFALKTLASSPLMARKTRTATAIAMK